MGYRNYISSISKEEHQKIKNLSKKKLYEYKGVDTDGYVGLLDIVGEELYGFGKYCDFSDDFLFKPVFSNKKLNTEFTDEGEFFIVDKDFLKHAIEHYTEKVKCIYSNLINGITDDNVKITQAKYEQLSNHIKNNSIEWLQLTPFDLDKGEEITTSWKFEYSIFELVRIYKSFDWKNNVMIYYGY